MPELTEKVGPFALLAVVSLAGATFRAAALTMALGLLLDAYLVRVLTVLVGRRSG